MPAWKPSASNTCAPASAPRAPWPTQRNKELGQLQLALERIASIQAEAVRVPTVPSGGGPTALSIQGTANIEALHLDYQVAVLFAASHTSGYRTDVLSGAIDSVGSRNTRGPLAGFYDIYSSNFEADNFSAVSNSQWHYGASTPLWIEDQPLYRGRIFAEAGSATLKAGEVKLLVNEFSQNDFGDTHSLVLLVDSLRVQNALTQLDPGLKEGTLATLLKAAANNKASSTSGTQGKADGDTLEQVANDLAKLLGVAGASLKGSLEGNTWALVPGPSGFTGREALQTLLNNIDLKIKADGLAGKFTVYTTHDAKLAQSDFAALLSLTLGATFSLRAKSEGDKTLINAKLGASYATELAQFNADQGSRASGNTTALNYTDQYLSDRSAALNWLITADTKNLPTSDSGSIEIFSPYAGVKTQFEDWDSGQKLTVGNPYEISRATQYIKFGDKTDNTLSGEELADHLYGGPGADTLKGYSGNDYLQGDSGADSLLGGQGHDTLNGGKDFDSYETMTDGGHDTIQDSDGLGKVTLAGIVLVGGKHVAGPEPVWESADGRVQYKKVFMPATGTYDLLVSVQGSAATVRIENWQPTKNLGITLADETAPALTLTNLEQYSAGVYDTVTGSNNADRISTGHKTDFVYGNNGDDTIALLDGNDVATGGLGRDWIDGGADNDYLIGGLTVGTPAQAEQDRDTLIGGLGSDLIKAGLGDDILIGSERNATITGADQTTQGDWLLGGEGDDIASGSLGRDFLNGGAGADTLDGGAGDDIILGDADYGFQTSFGASVSNGEPSLGIPASIAFAAEHRLGEDGSDTVTVAGAVTPMVEGGGDVIACDLFTLTSAGGLLRYPLLLSGTQRMNNKTDTPQDSFTQACWRTRRASVPARLRARGRGACGMRPGLLQHRGWHASSAATANGLRRSGTATRHVCGLGWFAGKLCQAHEVHSMRLLGLKAPEKRMNIDSFHTTHYARTKQC